MARRKVYLHIGLDDAGDTFIGRALDAHRQTLAYGRVLVPGTPADWAAADAELRRTHRESGLRRSVVEGRWSHLCKQIWAHRGSSVLSIPTLCRADPDQVALALDGLMGAELHLVVTARAEADQVYAAWQSQIESGRTTSLKTYTTRVLDPSSEHHQALDFRAGHDLTGILEHWAGAVAPDHVHVLDGADSAGLWHEFAVLLGLDATEPDPTPARIGIAQADVLRRVNGSLGDDLDIGVRRIAVADYLSRTVLAGQEAGSDTSTPENQLSAATEALGDVILEVARLREENATLRAANQHLDRKRRKHKRRLRALQRTGTDAAA